MRLAASALGIAIVAGTAHADVVDVPVELTAGERRMLEHGEISPTGHYGGVFASALLGFGTGQAVQGRYRDSGWIFTVGQGTSVALILAGAIAKLSACDGDVCDGFDGKELLIAGYVGFLVFHVVGIAEAATAPSRYNRKVRALRQRVGWNARVVPYVGPHAGGAAAGVTFRF